MGELVCEHGLQLLRLEPIQKPLRDRDRRRSGREAGRERVRRIGVHECKLRLRHVRERAQAVEDPMELRMLVRADRLRVHGPKRIRADHHDGDPSDHEQWKKDRRAAVDEDRNEDAKQDDRGAGVDAADEQQRQEHPSGEPAVPATWLATGHLPEIGRLPRMLKRLCGSEPQGVTPA